MTNKKWNGLRSVELRVPDVAANERFYTETWKLTKVAEEAGAVYLRGLGTYHHVLALYPHIKTELLSITFQAATRSDVDTLQASVKTHGAAATAPGAIAEPGGGYGFSFKDPDGHVFRVLAEDALWPAALPDRDGPERLAHVVLNSADADRATRFFVEALGFKLSDQSRIMDFVRCNSDHHNIAFVRASGNTLHHIAFQMADLDAVMCGAGRMKDSGHPIEWGVGRHGPGNNVFAYFLGPDEVPIEYTAEVQQVDDSYAFHGPEYWGFPAGRTDQWGLTAPPSERMHAAHLKIGFPERLPGG